MQLLHIVADKQTSQKGGQLFGVHTEVTGFNKDPYGHERHADKLDGQQIKQLEDGVQVKHVDSLKKALG